MPQQRPGFFESLRAGLSGMARGAIMLGLVGLAVGGLIGAVLGGSGLIAGGALIVGVTAGMSFAGTGMWLGSLLGAVTGVVQSREVQAADAQDVINVANIAFAQGVETGKSKQISHATSAELEQASSAFRAKLDAEKTNQPSPGMNR